MVKNLYSLYSENRKKIGRDALYLISSVLNTDKSEVLAGKEIDISDEKYYDLIDKISRRENGEPLQYLIGKQEFYGFEFYVGRGVLIPRADTEILVDTVLSNCGENTKIADLCSGSGCIAISLKKNKPSADITAYELYDEALDFLKMNVKENKADISIKEYDVLSKCDDEKFDIIVSNPPYLNDDDMENLQKEVGFEPKTALYGGDNGLYFYEEITRIWKSAVKEDGYLIYEIGINQHNDVARIMEKNGFCEIEKIKDLSGIIRVIKGKRRKN